jgi:hypothetical protein
MSNWMIPEDRLSDEQMQFIDCVFASSKEGETVLVQGFDSQEIMSNILHLIYDITRKYKNTSIAILVPNNLLISILSSELSELGVPKRNIQISNYFHFIQNNNKKFDYIFSIEGLELTSIMIKKLSKMTNILMLSGSYSASNNINPYTKEPTISKEEIALLVNRTWSFNIIYKLRRTLMNIVSLLNPSMSILSSKIDNSKTDVLPNLLKASTKEKEVEYILSTAKEKTGVSGQTVVVILPTQSDVIEFINIACKLQNISIFESNQESNYLMQLNQYLEEKQIDIAYIDNKNANELVNLIHQGKIILLSYKNIRFIDFDNVFLPFFSEKLDIDEYRLKSAIASVKLSLNITYSGKKHEYLERIESECNKVDIDKILNQSNNSNNFDDDFDF